jgi:glyoxylase-like metal-dependent hydrolase (beta-lactamase superfamily II)
MKNYIASILVIAAYSAIAQQNFDTVRIRPVKVSEQIYMLKGSGGNIGLLTGSDGTLMIDDQYAPLSAKISDAIKTISPNSVRFLINTHIHGDHTGGNDNFSKQGITIVAHDQVRERMLTEQVNKRLNRTTPPRDKAALPLVTFADKLNLHLNDEEIELIHLDRGHTDGDVAIYFKKANVIHTGDAFVRYGYPFIDESSGGTINGFVSSLDKILSLINDQTKVIPGHGEVATKGDVKILRDQIVDIRDQVSKALKKGKKMEEISALGITDKYDEKLGKGFLKGKDFVSIIAGGLSEAK